MIRIASLIFISAFYFIVFSPLASANSIEQLVAEGKLMVEVKLVNQEEIVVKQPVKISIEILTDRWFGGGNRIHDFDVESIVKLPLDAQATNGTVRRKGKQWTSQIREVTVFPMEAGTFDLPALVLDVAVNTTSGVLKGQIQTQAISFTAVLPAELETVSDYVVSSQFSVDVNGTFDSATPYKIGEAVTLSIRMTADGVPAMMLPTVGEINIPGVSIYAKKPRLNEKANRGELTSERREQLNFIFEQAGQYFLPEIS